MAGEHTRLVLLAQATEDPAARQLLMDELRAISPYAGGDDNEVADAMAAEVLARLRQASGHAP